MTSKRVIKIRDIIPIDCILEITKTTILFDYNKLFKFGYQVLYNEINKIFLIVPASEVRSKEQILVINGHIEIKKIKRALAYNSYIALFSPRK